MKKTTFEEFVEICEQIHRNEEIQYNDENEIIDSNIDLLTISFEKYVPKHLISLLYNFYFIFRSRYLIIKKTDSQNVSTQKKRF